MIRRLIGTLPDWAQKSHPHMRYLLAGEQKTSRWGRVIGFLSLLLIIGMFAMIGYANASTFFQTNPFELPLSMLLFEFLFWAMLILQVGLSITALLPIVNFVSTEKAKQTWDAIRTTHHGTNFIIRARWATTVFYRLRPVMLVLWLARLVLIGALLYDLTAFGGEYLSSLSANITPKLPQWGVLMLVVMGITASLLMPMTGVGINAALGLWLSTWVQKRLYVAMIQIFLVMLQTLLAGGFVILFLSLRDEQLANQLLSPNSPSYIPTWGVWILLLGFSLFADWGVIFLYLGLYAGTLWAKIPYGIFLGAGALAMVLVQAFITDRLLAWTVHRAEWRE
ncbi:MAG: hypothetical protein MUE54_06835 [Anaerolineae bacterium]|nr:hypothetical protein [Anaerolineae bacterium]